MTLDPALIANIRSWAERAPQVTRVWVFGSRARGDHRPDSDLDVAVDVDAEGFAERFGLYTDCTGRWKRELAALIPFEVDLQAYELDGDDSIVGPSVRAHGVLVFERDDSVPLGPRHPAAME